MKKILMVLLCVMVFTPMVFANGEKETQKDEKKDVTLTFLWFNNQDESQTLNKILEPYLAANPNVKVDLQILAGNSSYEQKIKMMVSGGNPPDLVRLSSGMLSNVISSLQPMDDYIGDTKAFKSNYYDGSIAYAINAQDKIVAIPNELTVNGMIVNKTAFDNAGIDVKEIAKTWTWTDWEGIVKKVITANPNMKYGLAVDYTTHRLSTMLYQFGGHYMNADQTKMDFNNPKTIAFLKYFNHLQNDGFMPKSVWLGSENPKELFQAGLVACHIGGSFNLQAYDKVIKDFDWCVVPMPKQEIRSSVLGGKFMATFKDSKNKDEAAKLLLYLADQKQTEDYCKGIMSLSSRKDSNIVYPTRNEDYQIFVNELAATPGFTSDEWKNLDLNKVFPYVLDQVVQVLMGNLTPEQAAANVDQKGSVYFK